MSKTNNPHVILRKQMRTLSRDSILESYQLHVITGTVTELSSEAHDDKSKLSDKIGAILIYSSDIPNAPELISIRDQKIKSMKFVLMR
jgi:hypothetical protein